LVPVLFTFYIQSVLKLKNNSGAKRLIIENTTGMPHLKIVAYVIWFKTCYEPSCVVDDLNCSPPQNITVSIPQSCQMFIFSHFLLLHVALCLGLVHRWTLRRGMPYAFWPCLYCLYSRPDCAPWRACTSMIAYITYAVSWWRVYPYVACIQSSDHTFFLHQVSIHFVWLCNNQSKNK